MMAIKKILIIVMLMSVGARLFPCTMILVGKNAAVDGSVLLAHNNDLPGNIAALMQVIPAARHLPGEKITFKNGLKIPQAEKTFRMLIMYCYYGFAEGDAVMMNEHQVAIAGGVALKKDRSPEAVEADPLIKKGVGGYVRYIALQRAKTARECVELIGAMYSKYGISYPSGVGAADPHEVWYLEAGGGRAWAARKVPDDSYLAVANGYRIGTVDFNDKENFILPRYLKKLLIKKGLWNPKKGPFHFAATFGRKRRNENDFYNTRRVWRVQALLTPSRQQAAGAFSYPEFLRPDKKITVPGLLAVLRDYYQGTLFEKKPSSNSKLTKVFWG
ncbi:MAG: C69 family dipeptidase, partial [Candidatus Aminicenantes bacterium]|nr:C69 family dipeptidase [Candidatus Aminicenantes bacterium]